jgi:hypothetical protein
VASVGRRKAFTCAASKVMLRLRSFQDQEKLKAC